MVNKYLILGLGITGLIGIAWMHGYSTGGNKCEAEYKAAQEKANKRQDELIQELEDARQNTREKVRTVYVEKDASGCDNTDIPDGVFSELSSED